MLVKLKTRFVQSAEFLKKSIEIYKLFFLDLKKDGKYTENKNWKTEAKVVLSFTRLQLCQ